MIEIAGYEGFELIGRGGFAVVYKARQISVGREVAIKLLSDPSPDTDLVRRFQRESRAVGALSWHPNIAAVVDAGTTDRGQAFIVFELLTGGSLEDRLDGAPMPWTEALTAMIQVADATQAAHDADVLHRDIKPANILMSRLGDAKLADFGIASMQDGTKTKTGTIAATIAHAAPELFDGSSASRATDVYALGSTLHTLLTGRPPFNPDPSEKIATVIRRIVSEPPPRLDPSLAPPEVAGAIAHALAKQPQYRPRSAMGFGKSLQAIQAHYGQPITAMPIGDQTPEEPAPATSLFGADDASLAAAGGSAPPADAGRPRRGGRAVIALLSLLVLAVAAAGAYVAWDRVQPESPIAVTEGGARIIMFDFGRQTQIPGLPGDNAIDRDSTTYWGLQPDPEGEQGITGTTFVLNFDAEVEVTRVGIDNGTSTELGRVSQVSWGTRPSREALTTTQELPDSPGAHAIDVSIETTQLVLAIDALHDPEAPNAGIAEILVEVR